MAPHLLGVVTVGKQALPTMGEILATAPRLPGAITVGNLVVLLVHPPLHLVALRLLTLAHLLVDPPLQDTVLGDVGNDNEARFM